MAFPNFRAIFCGFLIPLLLRGFPATPQVPAHPDANAIVQRSIETLKKDWQAAPEYDYSERDLEHQESRTYEVTMILGSPYRLLKAVDSVPLSPENGQKEERKLQSTIAQRCGESKEQRDQRIQQYTKDQKRNHELMEELSKAFVFRLLGEQSIDGHRAWILQATPRPGYQPTDNETKVLTGMHGKLWVDEATFQWVKVEASVIHAVSIEGFLAKVEPGTRFELEKAPVPGGVWLPKHFSVRSKAEVLSFIGHKTQDDETYFNYKTTAPSKVPACHEASPGETSTR